MKISQQLRQAGPLDTDVPDDAYPSNQQAAAIKKEFERFVEDFTAGPLHTAYEKAFKTFYDQTFRKYKFSVADAVSLREQIKILVDHLTAWATELE